MSEPRGLLRKMYEAPIAAAAPDKFVPPHLPSRPNGRTIEIGPGKTAASKAKAVEG